jgi:hypothetical protein
MARSAAASASAASTSTIVLTVAALLDGYLIDWHCVLLVAG